MKLFLTSWSVLKHRECGLFWFLKIYDKRNLCLIYAQFMRNLCAIYAPSSSSKMLFSEEGTQLEPSLCKLLRSFFYRKRGWFATSRTSCMYWIVRKTYKRCKTLHVQVTFIFSAFGACHSWNLGKIRISGRQSGLSLVANAWAIFLMSEFHLFSSPNPLSRRSLSNEPKVKSNI